MKKADVIVIGKKRVCVSIMLACNNVSSSFFLPFEIVSPRAKGHPVLVLLGGGAPPTVGRKVRGVGAPDLRVKRFCVGRHW